MPSMFDNIVSIVGPYERIHELCQGALNNRFLQTVKPIGEFAERRAIDTWGVKWEIQDPLAFTHDDVYGYDYQWSLEMEFESPWAPPLGAYEILNDEGLHVSAYFLNTGGLDYGGHYNDGEYHAFPLNRLPEDVFSIFNETYDYGRLQRSATPILAKPAEAISAS